MATKKVSKKPPMDHLTAIAFAHEAFERLHPEAPAWLWRYATSSIVVRDGEGDRDYHVVSFAWKPRTSTTGAESFFEVKVNAWNARTTVTLDAPIDKYAQDELEPYVTEP